MVALNRKLRERPVGSVESLAQLNTSPGGPPRAAGGALAKGEAKAPNSHRHGRDEQPGRT